MTFSRATVIACLLLGLLSVSVAQVPAEQQAEMAINAARKAYNEGNLPAAREQFKQFLQKFGGAPQATSARYGLALSFMNAPEQDFASALEPLNQATGDGNFADRGMVFYHLAVCNRALGIKEIEKGVATPAEIQRGARLVRRQKERRVGGALPLRSSRDGTACESD
jgi:cellulose synthase operon protein C